MAPALVALAVFAPWAVRDWLAFGSPLPGQALANALSVTGFDIFAWNDPPTLSRYLAVGPARLLEMRVDGLAHNLFTRPADPGLPDRRSSGSSRCRGRPRLRSVAPLAILSVTTFLVTSLVFPVATTWGTFLHAAGPAHVLLIVSALLALDAFIAWVGRPARLDPAGRLARRRAHRLRRRCCSSPHRRGCRSSAASPRRS